MIAMSWGRVPVVLDSVVGVIEEEAHNRSPLIVMENMDLCDDGIFKWDERAMLHLGAQLVAPP